MERPQDDNSAQRGYLLVLNWHVQAPGGVSQVVHNLGVELEKLGWLPTILVNDWQAKSPQTDHAQANPLVSWRIRSPWDQSNPTRNLISYLFGLPARIWIWLRLAREHRWHVVNFHYPGPSAGFWILLRDLGLWNGAIVVSVHGGEIRGAPTSTDPIGMFLLRRVLIRADAIVACSASLGNDVIALVPETKERLRVISNGVDVDALANKVDSDFVLPPQLNSKPFILNVATYEAKKSQEVLIRAFSIVAAQYDSVQLVIVGRSTPYLEKVRACATASGFSERIHLLVDLPHASVMNWMSRAAIFCLPSESEGHPLAIMEATAFELPVVATSIGGIREIISGADEGLLVPVSDHEALACALNQLIEEPETAANLGRNLRRSVESRYSWARTGKEYSELGRALLKRRGESRGRG